MRITNSLFLQINRELNQRLRRGWRLNAFLFIGQPKRFMCQTHGSDYSLTDLSASRAFYFQTVHIEPSRMANANRGWFMGLCPKRSLPFWHSQSAILLPGMDQTPVQLASENDLFRPVNVNLQTRQITTKVEWCKLWRIGDTAWSCKSSVSLLLDSFVCTFHSVFTRTKPSWTFQ